jgi:hypothetical protein
MDQREDQQPTQSLLAGAIFNQSMKSTGKAHTTSVSRTFSSSLCRMSWSSTHNICLPDILFIVVQDVLVIVAG